MHKRVFGMEQEWKACYTSLKIPRAQTGINKSETNSSSKAATHKFVQVGTREQSGAGEGTEPRADVCALLTGRAPNQAAGRGWPRCLGVSVPAWEAKKKSQYLGHGCRLREGRLPRWRGLQNLSVWAESSTCCKGPTDIFVLFSFQTPERFQF